MLTFSPKVFKLLFGRPFPFECTKVGGYYFYAGFIKCPKGFLIGLLKEYQKKNIEGNSSILILLLTSEIIFEIVFCLWNQTITRDRAL